MGSGGKERHWLDKKNPLNQTCPGGKTTRRHETWIKKNDEGGPTAHDLKLPVENVCKECGFQKKRKRREEKGNTMTKKFRETGQNRRKKKKLVGTPRKLAFHKGGNVHKK